MFSCWNIVARYSDYVMHVLNTVDTGTSDCSVWVTDPCFCVFSTHDIFSEKSASADSSNQAFLVYLNFCLKQ